MTYASSVVMCLCITNEAGHELGRLSFFSISTRGLLDLCLSRCREVNVKRFTDAKEANAFSPYVIQYERNEIVRGCIDGNAVLSFAGHLL